MAHKLVSIVTVCKNSAFTISKTIKSVLAQNYPGLEYIIIDGASNDGTQEVVSSFGSAIDIFVSDQDDGIADAFNKGILCSSGDIIGLINSDDCLLPGTVNKVVSFFAEHPDVDVLHGDVDLYDGIRFIKKVRPAGRWWYPWRLVLFNHPATFVRRSVYERHGLFDKNFHIAMDVEIFLRWIRKSVKIVYLPDVLVVMQAGGVSSQNAKQGYQEVRRALIAYRFPQILSNVQYAAKVWLQWILSFKSKYKKIFFVK
jgi:glycosyltransferase involved in cell wall biosynthesis